MKPMDGCIYLHKSRKDGNVHPGRKESLAITMGWTFPVSIVSIISIAIVQD